MPLDIARITAFRSQNHIHYFLVVGSTMTEATGLAASGAPHGTVVLADEQTGGLGRLGRSWISQADAGVYCSILMRLSLSPVNLPVASLLLGLAVSEAIQKSTQLTCDLRWPNDVLIHERKVAGVLLHLVDGCIIGGVGINVNQNSFPPDLRTPATSLSVESGGHAPRRETVIVNLLESIELFCSMLQSQGPETILRLFISQSSYAVNRRVIVEENGAKGVTAGLDENGFLLVRSESGRLDKVSSGGVRPDR